MSLLRHLRQRPLAAAAVAVVALCLAGLLADVAAAGWEARAGAADINHAQIALKPHSAAKHLAQALLTARLDLVGARARFRRANRILAPLRPVVVRLGWLPWAGGAIADLPTALRAAGMTAGAAVSLLDAMAPVASTLDQPGGAHDRLPRALALLSERTPRVNAACRRLEAVRPVVAAAPVPLTHTRFTTLRSLGSKIDTLITGCHALAAVPAALGFPHARRYLLAYQDSNELKATGGFMGSIGVLTIDHGVIHQWFRDTGGFPKEPLDLPAPEPMARYNLESWLLRDSNWSPDFPTTAAIERYFFRLDAHQQVDGVLNLTPAVIADLLRATGPIYSPQYHRWITYQNIAALADYYTHVSRYYGPLHILGINARKQFIPIVASLLVPRLQTLSGAEWLKLERQLAYALATRDLQMNFTDPSLQHLVNAVGVSGEVSRTRTDYLFVVDTNLSYNKINPWVHISYAYTATIQPDRWVHSRLTIHFDNRTPRSYNTSAAMGPGAGLFGGKRDYADFVRIYVPAGAQLVDQSGWTEPWSPGPAYGKTMFSGYVTAFPNLPTDVTLEYVIPPNVFSWSAGRAYRLLVQHQAGSHPDAFTVTVRDGSTSRRWRVRHPVTDWTEQMPIASRPFSPIPLPAATPVVVAPGHWIEPHMYFDGPRV